MGDILSQDEVDNLLKGLTSGDIETTVEESEEAEDVLSYDFTSQDRIIRGRMPTLEIITERFSRMFRANLSSMIRKVVDIEVASVDMVKFAEFHNSLPVPSSLHIFRMEPLRGYEIFVLESQLAFNLIECYFGGHNIGNLKVEGREFTLIESKIIEKMVKIALNDLLEAWKPIYKIKTNYVRSEINPKFAAIVLPTDLVIVIRFALDLEGVGGFMILCIPYASVETIRNVLYASFQTDEVEAVDSLWKDRLKTSAMDLSVDMVVELGNTYINTERLMHLEEGDVLLLDKGPADLLIGKIGGVSKFMGHPGVRQGNKSFKIEKRYDEEKKD
ncbi:flagellar motor switch protein FliM [Candidatus Magnetomoraceae bacterium gMMP-15]